MVHTEVEQPYKLKTIETGIAKRESILKTIAQIEEKEFHYYKAANEEIKRLRDIAQKEIEESTK